MDRLRKIFKSASMLIAGLALSSAAHFTNAAGTGETCQQDQHPYIAFDMRSGHKILGHNETAPIQPASIAKMMTMLLIFEAERDGLIDFNDHILMSRDSVSEGNKNGGFASTDFKNIAKALKTLTLKDVVTLIALRSFNDYAIAVAKDVAKLRGSDKSNTQLTRDFVVMMNQKAENIGMFDTHFDNVTGLPSDKSKTTVKDLGILLKHINDEWPELKALMSEKEFDAKRIYAPNMVTLMQEPTYAGFEIFGKTGTINKTGAGWAVSVKNNTDRQIGLVTFCHKSGKKNWADRHYTSVDIINASFEKMKFDIDRVGQPPFFNPVASS
jgi:D-alanyl-D-alanine carboxypeptidase (penicillin-binding protein 5/6)